jgi:hypothetical protein
MRFLYLWLRHVTEWRQTEYKADTGMQIAGVKKSWTFEELHVEGSGTGIYAYFCIFHGSDGSSQRMGLGKWCPLCCRGSKLVLNWQRAASKWECSNICWNTSHWPASLAEVCLTTNPGKNFEVGHDHFICSSLQSSYIHNYNWYQQFWAAYVKSRTTGYLYSLKLHDLRS